MSLNLRLAFTLLATILMGTQAESAQRTSSDKVESTLGQAPPQGAVVLFDGSSFDAWKPFSCRWINPEDDQKQVQWKLVDGKAMRIALEYHGKRRKQFLCTKAKCGGHRLHLEFQLPEDGGKGNSGIFEATDTKGNGRMYPDMEVETPHVIVHLERDRS